jgi:signal transduction histidine kinase
LTDDRLAGNDDRSCRCCARNTSHVSRRSARAAAARALHTFGREGGTAMNESRRIGSQLRLITDNDLGRASAHRIHTDDFSDGNEDTIECSCYSSTPRTLRRVREPIRHRTLRRH